MNVITVMHGCMLHEVLNSAVTLIPNYIAQLNQCYLSEYKQQHGNPYKWAYLWDKFPLSKKLVSLAL